MFGGFGRHGHREPYCRQPYPRYDQGRLLRDPYDERVLRDLSRHHDPYASRNAFGTRNRQQSGDWDLPPRDFPARDHPVRGGREATPPELKANPYQGVHERLPGITSFDGPPRGHSTLGGNPHHLPSFAVAFGGYGTAGVGNTPMFPHHRMYPQRRGTSSYEPMGRGGERVNRGFQPGDRHFQDGGLHSDRPNPEERRRRVHFMDEMDREDVQNLHVGTGSGRRQPRGFGGLNV